MMVYALSDADVWHIAEATYPNTADTRCGIAHEPSWVFTVDSRDLIDRVRFPDATHCPTCAPIGGALFGVDAAPDTFAGTKASGDMWRITGPGVCEPADPPPAEGPALRVTRIEIINGYTSITIGGEENET